MYSVLKPDFSHEDDRGKLIQLVHDGWKQINVVYSKSGTVRGGHHHKKNQEAFYIIDGCCEVILEADEKMEVHTFKTGDFFSIQPGVCHTFQYLKDTLLVGLYDKGVEIGGGSTLSADNVCGVFTLQKGEGIC